MAEDKYPQFKDARHSHGEPTVPKHHATKDRRKWCRGKVGREHHFEWVQDKRWSFSGPVYLKQCQNCGKHGPSCWSSSWHKRSKPNCEYCLIRKGARAA